MSALGWGAADKNAARRAHLVFVDESGFQRLGYPGLSAPPAPVIYAVPSTSSGIAVRFTSVSSCASSSQRTRGSACTCFPPTPPEFNPAEFMWTQADRELANGAADDLAELRHHLDAAIRRLIADAAFDSRRTGRAECWSAKAASGKAPLVPRSGATLRPL